MSTELSTETDVSKPEHAQRVRPGYTGRDIVHWSYDEAAEYSGLSRTSLHNYASRGFFAVRKRGLYRVDRASFERFLNGDK